MRVAASDASTNTVTVTRENGAAVSYDPRRLQGVSVYREAERAFAVGDRVQFTAPFQEQHVANRELGTIEKMSARVLQEVQRFQKEGPSEDLVNRAKETARRNYETQLRQNDYWLRRFQAVQMWGQDPAMIAHRPEQVRSES